MEYVGFLADQTRFDSGKSEFVLGKCYVTLFQAFKDVSKKIDHVISAVMQ